MAYIHTEISLLDLNSKYRFEELRTKFQDMDDLNIVLKTMEDEVKKFIDDIQFNEFLTYLKNGTSKFTDYMKELVSRDVIILEQEPEKAIKAIYAEELNTLLKYKAFFNEQQTRIATIKSALNTVRNSYSKFVEYSPVEHLEKLAGKPLKSQAAIDRFTEHMFSYVENIENILDIEKDRLYKDLSLVDKLIDIALRKESSIRLFYKSIESSEAAEERLSRV